MNKILHFLLMITISQVPSAESWNKEFTKDGITVFTKNISGSAVRSFRAETEINAPMEIVNSVLSDTLSQVKWMPDCIVSEILVKDSALYEISYNETKVPFVSNRDVIVESIIRVSPDKVVHKFRALDRPDLKPEIKGIVRIKDMDGKWEISRNNQKTYVIYEVRAHPGGNIPAWIVNVMSADMPYKVMRALISVTEAARTEAARTEAAH